MKDESWMTEALIETWLVNNRIDLLLIDELTDEGLRASLSERGGRTVGQQLVHLLDIRRRKIEKADPALAKKLPKVTREQGHDRARLRAGFERSATPSSRSSGRASRTAGASRASSAASSTW